MTKGRCGYADSSEPTLNVNFLEEREARVTVTAYWSGTEIRGQEHHTPISNVRQTSRLRYSGDTLLLSPYSVRDAEASSVTFAWINRHRSPERRADGCQVNRKGTP